MKTSPKTIFDPRYDQLIADLVAVRKKKGWTQRELAKQSKHTHCFIGRTEIKERRLDLIETIDLMKVLGLSKAEITKKISELFRNVP